MFFLGDVRFEKFIAALIEEMNNSFFGAGCFFEINIVKKRNFFVDKILQLIKKTV